MRTLEHIIPLTVLNGETSATVDVKLPQGQITHVACFFRDYSAIQDGFVRASIKDVTGLEISKMQSIENYRDREAGYLAGKKPLEIEGGNVFTFTVQATQAFTADFLAELVFIYKSEEGNCNYN